MSDADAGPAGGGPQLDQVALVTLCILGLFVAALASPVAAPSAGGGDGPQPDGGADGTVGSDGDDTGYRIPGLIELLRWVLEVWEPGAEDGDASDRCRIEVEPQATPGQIVTVRVVHAGDPVAGALVHFEGEPIGRTDGDGEVTGEVPYVRTLTIAVDLPGTTRCVDTTPTNRAALGSRRSLIARPVAQASDNLTDTVTVEGDVGIGIIGQADPGSTVDVVAHVAEIPMRNATVRANGQRVARTDTTGRATVRVPADGTERLRITVHRGAFAGSRTVSIRLLRARLVPADLIALPGRPATLHAHIGEDPADGAVVTVDGRRLGTTSADGRHRLTLPADPRTTLTVRYEGQTARTGVGILYIGTAVVLLVPTLVVVGVAIAIARRRRLLGRRLLAVGSWLARGLRRGSHWLVGVALVIATALERASRWLLDRIATMVVGLTRQLRAGLPSMAATVWSALRRLPGRGGGALVGAIRWLRRLPGRLWALLWTGSATEAGRQLPPTNVSADEPFDLRTAWRAVASRIAPDSWRVRTPREIVTLAADTPIPSGPLERLATAFEEVEYGNRALDGNRLHRAKSAARTLREREYHSDTVEEGDGS